MELIDAGTTNVKYKGIFDWGGLYQLIAQWLYNRKYEVHENRYKDKESTPWGNEIEVTVNAHRRITAYIRYTFTIDYHLWDAKEIEVVEDGKKVKKTQGRILVSINAGLQLDWTDKFKGSKFNELLGKLIKTIKKKEIKILHEDYQEYENYALQTEIKKFLKMETDRHEY
ncbi:MAG: hypothetical protein ABIC91_00490 [Nanoarchaeota archaeon]|nr:hypothetical protein [Nanoarchaeota archaeon]MBU1030212.1 hypothetical protein [Nanoarchaeota archaeon]MBU1850594.1 hypothetical protein [Nanoarchaeota archaeon]